MTEAIRYLSTADAIEINKRMVARFGGACGVRDAEMLDSAIAQPAASFGGDDLYATLPEKAARYAIGITLNHPFIDGNKRTAAGCIAAFLAINGVSFNPETGVLADKVLALASGELSPDEFSLWVISSTD